MSDLQTAQSLSIYTSDKFVTSSERSVTIGEKFRFEKKGIGLIQEDGEEEQKKVLNEFQKLGIEEVEAVNRPPLYLAAGLGMYGYNVGSDGGIFSMGFDVGGDVEENYKRMVGEDPSNPLFLRNYAQLLQVKVRIYVDGKEVNEFVGVGAGAGFGPTLESKEKHANQTILALSNSPDCCSQPKNKDAFHDFLSIDTSGSSRVVDLYKHSYAEAFNYKCVVEPKLRYNTLHYFTMSQQFLV
ncbi:hypothetical protein U1Q18_015017 [Sarracenia purpurea var. burkii]